MSACRCYDCVGWVKYRWHFTTKHATHRFYDQLVGVWVQVRTELTFQYLRWDLGYTRSAEHNQSECLNAHDRIRLWEDNALTLSQIQLLWIAKFVPFKGNINFTAKWNLMRDNEVFLRMSHWNGHIWSCQVDLIRVFRWNNKTTFGYILNSIINGRLSSFHQTMESTAWWSQI